MNHSLKASELFLSGYNCSQSVALAFCDFTKLDETFTAKAVSPFGGGMGRMREVCGAVSGMLFVLGVLYGYDSPTDNEAKKQVYADVQDLASKFKEEAGSIICREILKNPDANPNPSKRTAEYYKKRPCERMVILASELLDEFIEAHPLDN